MQGLQRREVTPGIVPLGVPLPGVILVASLLAFALTWILAPRAALFGLERSRAIAVPQRAPQDRPRTDSLRLEPSLHVPQRAFPAGTTLDGLGKPYFVALTFDDGPHPIYTRRLLEVLEAHRVKATFFVNGKWLAPGHPGWSDARAVLELAHRRGHVIANHGYAHRMLIRSSREEQTDEIVAGDQILENLLGERPRYFRAPYAAMTRHARAILEERGYVEVLWTAAPPEELAPDAETVRDSLLLWVRHFRGGIVLLHDRTAECVAGTELFLTALEHENQRRLARGEPIFHVVPLDSFL